MTTVVMKIENFTVLIPDEDTEKFIDKLEALCREYCEDWYYKFEVEN